VSPYDSHFVLVLEPSHIAARQLEAAFHDCKVCNPTRVLRNVYELRSYLTGAGLYSNRELFPEPSLLLLDFNDPGAAVNQLKWLKDRQCFNRFPVIGVGNAVPSEMLQLSFDLGMNGYFEKPAEMNELARMICGLTWVDGWKLTLSDFADAHLLTREQFYRTGAA